jgi:hypothetical protein
MQLWLYYQCRGVKHLEYININKVTTYINYVMITNMVVKQLLA